MKSGTQHHIKTKRLMRLLDLPVCFAVGVIETLWLVTAECADEGNIGKYSNAEIADALGWPGEADKLVSALLEARWLDECDMHRLVIHDWIDHCPDYIRERLRKRGWRKTKRLTSTEHGTGTGQAGTTTGPAAACPAFTQPNPTKPNQSNQEEAIASCPETDTVGSRQKPVDEPVASIEPFPCDGPHKSWTLTQSRLDHWQATYPSLDALAEIRKARQWLLDNPARRKTAKGMPRFIGNWLGRAQDRNGQARASPHGQQPKFADDTKLDI